MFLSLADLPVRDALPGLRVWVETARLACHEKPAGLLIILRDLEWPFPDLCILTTNFDKKIKELYRKNTVSYTHLTLPTT
mgnify:CR=1 FL=1